jgi:hypothetical protein
LKILYTHEVQFLLKSKNDLSKKKFFNNKSFCNYKDHTEGYNNNQYVMYNEFVFKNFLKKKKFFHHKYINMDKISLRKTKNNKTSFLKNFIQVLVNGGNKLQVLKHVNKINNSFYFLYENPEKEFIKKYTSFNFFKNFSNLNSNFFNFNSILAVICELNRSIFDLKVIKLNKKEKKKRKVKYNIEIKYLSKSKRFTNVLKNINLNSNSYNYYKYDERLLASIFDGFFLQKNSVFFKKKIFIYNSVLKKRSSSI